jgi:3-hydroxyisobutyrate dehydrogenase
MSLGFKGAQEATLTFLVGADSKESFTRVEDYVKHMGKKAIHCGDIGTGQVAKVCNNMMLGIR